jgi:predicted dehydrogenase
MTDDDRSQEDADMASEDGGRPVRWGIVGTGPIAAEFVAGIKESTSSVTYAVASRSEEKASDFARQFGIPMHYDSYEALISDDEVDVVYVATPHSEHERWAVEALHAARNVLCEKPLTMDAPSAQRVVDAARVSGTFLMEAFMYRFHPQTLALISLIKSGAIGEPKMASVSFGFDIGPVEGTRLTNRSLGGGGILDVGCYATAVTRLIAALAAGVERTEPIDVVGAAWLDPVEGIDLVAIGCLAFSGGFLAQVSCGVRARLDDAIRIYGSDGEITVPRPCWLDEYHKAGLSELIVRDTSGRVKEIPVESTSGVFAYEVDHVASVLPSAQSPIVPWEETMANMRTLDRWRAAVGVNYDDE